jgi:drug/metabolite transporter (DMT)-like permease
MAVAVLILGIFVALLPKMMSQGAINGERQWMILYIASAVPSAASSVLRERIFRDDSVKMDAFYMGFWCSLCNVTLGLPMILFSGIPLSGIIPNFEAGFRCYLWGQGNPLCDKAFFRSMSPFVLICSFHAY